MTTLKDLIEREVKKTESELFASLGAMNMAGVMEGKTTDGAIHIRDKAVDSIQKKFRKSLETIAKETIDEVIELVEQELKMDVEITDTATANFSPKDIALHIRSSSLKNILSSLKELKK